MSNVQGIHRRTPVNVTEKLRSRFWPRVHKHHDKDECWNWTGAMRNGYGAIKHQRQVLSAHRVAYILTHGEPDPSLVIGHKCDNRACCNPNHLEAITPGKNNTDARGRRTFHMTRGEDAHNAVLNDKLVLVIRQRHAAGESYRSIARDLGLLPKTVQSAGSGKTWKHVPQIAGATQ